MIGFAAERLMELEIGARTGAVYADRLAHRNGFIILIFAGVFVALPLLAGWAFADIW